MKSKYTKIFMIFAVVFAMVAALFVSPKAAYAEEAEQVQLTASEEYDVNSISASIPDTAIISFPVPYESVYGNEIDWAVQADQNVLSYDRDAHWVVVNRPTKGDAQTVKLYLKLKGHVVKTFEITVPAGQTAVPSYSYTLNYNYDEKVEEGTYKLGQASITLPTPTREEYIFNGWKDAEGKVYTKILVGSMEKIELTADWTKIVVDRIGLDTTNLVKTDYISGDPLKTEGLVVTAHFNDGTNRVVTEGIEFDTERIEYNESGEVTIKVTYQGKSASFKVNVSKKENSVVIADFNGWTYGTPVVPTATSTHGTPILLYSNSEKGVYSEEVPTNAGLYYVKAVVEEGTDFLGAESDPVAFTISEKNITLTPVSQGTVNIADVHNLKWSFTTNDLVYEDSLPEEYEGLVVKYYLEENGEPVNPMAGKVYIVKFSGFTMDNYIVTFVDGSLSVKSEELYFSIPDVKYVYDGTIKMFTAKAYAKNGDNDILIEDAEVVYTYNGQPFTGATLANEEGYSVTVSIDSPSYGKLEQVVSFVIEKATIDTNSVTLTGGSKPYNRNDQMISVQGLPENDKLEVSYNITEAINVGTYEVVATISSNDPNYKVSKSELTARLEITKAANPVTVAIQGWTYGDEAKAPSATVIFGEATFTYATQEDGEYTSTVPTNAGTYYVKATVAGTVNYEAASATQEFTIAQAEIDTNSVKLTDRSNPYTGENQMIEVSELPTNVSVKYVIKLGEETVSEIVNVGTYKVVATLESTDSNYKVSKSEFTATVEITKAANPVTVEIEGWTYGQEAKVPTVRATFGEVTYKFFKEDGTELAECPTDAGNYYVEATVEGTDNYEGDSETANFTISKKRLTNDDVKVIVLGSDFNTSVETTLTPDVEVYYNQTQITTYNELQYVYGDAVTKLGTATVTIVLNGNYEGTLTAPFEVTEFGQAGVDAAGLPETIDEAYLTANALPVTVGQGEVKSNVLWSSSNTAVSVNPVTGQVSINKAQLSEDTTIILTAIVTYGTTSAYKVTYNVVITEAPEEEDITSNGVTIFDAPYGYDVVAEEVTDTNDNANYKSAVEANEGYEYVNAYNISLKDELGQSAQPGKTVLVRINGTFDTSKTYRVYYVNESKTTEIIPTTVDETYIEFETDHFSIYAIAVEKTSGPTDITETISFESTENRVSQDSEKQVWGLENVTITNNKKSGTNIADSSNPVRFYKNSEIVFKAPGNIKTIVIETSGGEYAVVPTTLEGATVAQDGNKFTITLTESTTEYAILLTEGQIRVYSITVTYTMCNHNLVDVAAKASTCFEQGHTGGKECSYCDYVTYEKLPLLDHDFGEYTQTLAPTCGEVGFENAKCLTAGCEATDTKEIPALQHNFVGGSCINCGAEGSAGNDSEPVNLATFEFGANGTAEHVDGNSLGSSKTYTEGDYKLSLTSLSNVYGPAYDAKGNSCIKLGASSKAGSLTFTVPDDVTEVIICVAKYKANTTKINVNGTAYTLTKNSNDGAYDEIVIDTTGNKTVTFTTVSGGYRAMINTIVFKGEK